MALRSTRPTTLIVLIIMIDLITDVSANTIVEGVEFFGYDADEQNSVENEDPCFYDARRNVDGERVEKCLDQVKRLASDTSSYWFGEHWKTACASQRASASNPISCYNPPKLQRYESLGARLLRVPTFDMAYLRNLVVFPQMTFVSNPGQYMACDHVFRSDDRQEIRVSPNMAPAPPWHLRKQPIIRWTPEAASQNGRRSAINGDTSDYIMLIVDVGFGDLYYLAYNYPTRMVTVKDYSGPLNFREVSNPVALLIFRQPSFLRSLDWRPALEDDSSFNVQRFMIKNNLTQSWIGLNWINVGTDGYAIEEQRRTSFVDNCPLLIRNRIVSPLDGVRMKFLPTASLISIDTWMSITYFSKMTTFLLCCKKYSFEAAEMQLDPLGDKELRPVYVRHAPNISVLRPPPVDSEIYAYRRFSRDYMTVPDDGHYTLLMLDTEPAPVESSSSPLALWLVINIRGTNLHEFTENKAGMTVLPYMAPSPTDDRLRRYVFLLFRQQGPVTKFDTQHYSPGNCKSKFIGRCSFNVQDLMARNGLTLRALNWMLSRQDEYARYDLVKKGEQDQKKLCYNHGAHYEEHCHPMAVKIIGADGRVVTSSASSSIRFRSIDIRFVNHILLLRTEYLMGLAAFLVWQLL